MSDIAKTVKALLGQRSVQKPLFGLRCWAVVKQPSTGSFYSRYIGRYDNCLRPPRKGCLTCRQHEALEADALDLNKER